MAIKTNEEKRLGFMTISSGQLVWKGACVSMKPPVVFVARKFAPQEDFEGGYKSL